MGPLIGAGLIQAGSNLVSNLFNLGQAKKEREARKELAEYQYSKDLEMWNKANEYNSPAAQMKRLQDAGLNPNLAFGSGSVAGNTSPAQMPRYQAFNPEYGRIDVQVPNILAMLGQYQDLKSKKAQTDNLLEQNLSLKLNNLQKELNNSYLSKTLSNRINMLSNQNYQSLSKSTQEALRAAWMEDQTMQKMNPLVIRYQLDAQKLKQEQRMNDVDYQLKSLEYDLGKRGLSKQDSAFLKAVSLNQQGYKGIDNLMPYIVGYEGFNKLKFGAGFLKLLGK